MPEKVIANFEVRYVQIMDEKSNVDEKLLPKLGKPALQQMYASMVLARKFDEQALKLQRQGRIGTYASHQGQEASQIECCGVHKQGMDFSFIQGECRTDCTGSANAPSLCILGRR